MSSPKIKRLVACFGSIQLVTVLSVLSYREQSQQELNLEYENYLVITPLLAPQGQSREFAAFLEKMAKSFCSWEKIMYIPLSQIKTIAKKINSVGLSGTFSLVHELVGVKKPDEIYLSHNYKFEDQLLLNVYESAKKICYGNGIGIYNSQSPFPQTSLLKHSSGYLKKIYMSLKEKLKVLFPPKSFLSQKEFDIGYFSHLPCAFGELPTMETVILDSAVYLKIFQRLEKSLDSLIDINYMDKLRTKVQEVPTSILLTSNFSEASGRMTLENEIAAYREFLETQGIPKDSILLIKPHPRDSKLRILNLKSALSDLYSDIFVFSEGSLFYLPFELLFMDLFHNPTTKVQKPRIFTFSSACLTLELLFNAECVVGFGSDIVKKFFYKDQAFSRIKHETDLLTSICEVRKLNASLIPQGW